MSFKVGQGVLGRITFRDGIIPAYDRVYLVVKVCADEIQVLNISSIQGKEFRLIYPENREILNYCPPFLKPSFVKLNSLVSVKLCDCSCLKILHSGELLDKAELDDIINNIIY